jgi:YVTN family beta-propeller protein
VAIAGSQAVVVNQDNDTVSIVDLTTGAVQKTLAVGDGPETVAVDAATRMAFVTDGNDGTVSVINLATLAVANTFTLGAAVRPHGIALITGAGVALVTAPSAGPDGTAILLNLVTGATISTIKANPERSGGSTAVAYFNSKVYFANQTGGSVSVLPVNPATGAATGPLTTIKVDLGARALAIDTKDNLLVVSNEGSGTLVLVNLATNTVVGRINAVRTNLPGDTGKNDRSDRDEASNIPAVQSITPASGRAGATIIVTITGVSLTGATAVTFDSPGGNDKDKDKDEDKDDKKGSDSFAATNVQVAAGGTRITATVSIPAGAKPGARVVRVKTANGTSSGKGEGAAMFVVMP